MKQKSTQSFTTKEMKVIEPKGKHQKIYYSSNLRRSANFAGFHIFFVIFNKNLRNIANANCPKIFKDIFIKICNNLQNCRFIKYFCVKIFEDFHFTSINF